MSWLLRNLPLLFFFFVVFSIMRAIKRAQKLSTQHKAGSTETDEQRRVREIQERIRRIAAERRGGLAPPAMPRATEPAPRTSVPVPPLDPFAGPMRRIERALERRMPPATPPLIETKSAELERQQQLAAEIRKLEQARAFAQRRAADVIAEGKAHDASEGGMLTAARGDLLEDLRDPQSLRRAFVLREVLGAPVGLR